MHPDKKFRRATAPAIAVVLTVSCTDEPVANIAQGSAGDATSAAETSSGVAPISDASAGEDSATSNGDTTSEPHIFDVAGFTDAGHRRPPTPTCEVFDGLDAVGDCADEAPPDSFAPMVQWAWAGNGDEVEVIVTPVVANLTDDNDDGAIDLCDIPDVVVVAFAGVSGEGHIYVLDGATGAEHFRVDNPVGSFNTPAIGDLDGDGVPEIVAVHGQGAGDYRMFAVHHDGTLL